MKRKIIIIAIILLVIACVCFALSKWFYYQGGLVMDGPGEFYHKMGQRVRVCEDLSEGFGVAGVLTLIVSFFIRKR